MMTHYLVQSLNNISAIALIENCNVFVFTTDSRLCKFDKSFNLIWETTSLKTQWQSFNYMDFIYPYRQYQLIMAINKKTGSIDNLLELDIYPVELIGNILWIEKCTGQETYVSSYNLTTNTIDDYCRLSKSRLKKINTNSTFLALTENLSCHSIFDGSELWRTDMPSEIEGNLFTYEDLIIVPSKDRILRSFDIVTGKQIWQADDVYGFNLFLHNDKIYCLVGDTFEIIDARTGRKIIHVNMEEENKKEGLFFQVGLEHAFDGECIYFSSELSPKIGAFNVNTCKVEWLFEFEKPSEMKVNYFLQRPQYHEGKLYVLDNNQRLHIFEHEKAND